ncbi:MAG: hypothetical protein MIO92_04545 [Methanosarcinaceae archaeon]|nr:hypothetical protein [Methanosarcinaceae archaeon]
MDHQAGEVETEYLRNPRCRSGGPPNGGQLHPSAKPLAKKTALWYIHHMQGRDRYYNFCQFASGIHSWVAMIHPGQATICKALASNILSGRLKAG